MTTKRIPRAIAVLALLVMTFTSAQADLASQTDAPAPSEFTLEGAEVAQVQFRAPVARPVNVSPVRSNPVNVAPLNFQPSRGVEPRFVRNQFVNGQFVRPAQVVPPFVRPVFVTPRIGQGSVPPVGRGARQSNSRASLPSFSNARVTSPSISNSSVTVTP